MQGAPSHPPLSAHDVLAFAADTGFHLHPTSPVWGLHTLPRGGSLLVFSRTVVAESISRCVCNIQAFLLNPTGSPAGPLGEKELLPA